MNQERAQLGCPALVADAGLESSAAQHSADMAATGEIFISRHGENVAHGPRSADQVVAQWMTSDGARANILNCNFTRAGVGVVSAGWWWTMDFSR